MSLHDQSARQGAALISLALTVACCFGAGHFGALAMKEPVPESRKTDKKPDKTTAKEPGKTSSKTTAKELETAIADFSPPVLKEVTEVAPIGVPGPANLDPGIIDFTTDHAVRRAEISKVAKRELVPLMNKHSEDFNVRLKDTQANVEALSGYMTTQAKTVAEQYQDMSTGLDESKELSREAAEALEQAEKSRGEIQEAIAKAQKTIQEQPARVLANATCGLADLYIFRIGDALLCLLFALLALRYLLRTKENLGHDGVISGKATGQEEPESNAARRPAPLGCSIDNGWHFRPEASADTHDVYASLQHIRSPDCELRVPAKLSSWLGRLFTGRYMLAKWSPGSDAEAQEPLDLVGPSALGRYEQVCLAEGEELVVSLGNLAAFAVKKGEAPRLRTDIWALKRLLSWMVGFRLPVVFTGEVHIWLWDVGLRAANAPVDTDDTPRSDGPWYLVEQLVAFPYATRLEVGAMRGKSWLTTLWNGASWHRRFRASNEESHVFIRAVGGEQRRRWRLWQLISHHLVIVLLLALALEAGRGRFDAFQANDHERTLFMRTCMETMEDSIKTARQHP